jgi:hypothetical protein
MFTLIWSIFKNLTFVTPVTHKILTCEKFKFLKPQSNRYKIKKIDFQYIYLRELNRQELIITI